MPCPLPACDHTGTTFAVMHGVSQSSLTLGTLAFSSTLDAV